MSIVFLFQISSSHLSKSHMWSSLWKIKYGTNAITSVKSTLNAVELHFPQKGIAIFLSAWNSYCFLNRDRTFVALTRQRAPDSWVQNESTTVDLNSAPELFHKLSLLLQTDLKIPVLYEGKDGIICA